MGRLEFPISEHRAIRKSKAIQAELKSIAKRIASQAGMRAGVSDGYSTDMTVGSDRARAHVWPSSREAIRAENKSAPLMGIVGDRGLG